MTTPKRYVIAVSGGVDSVVLLDMLARRQAAVAKTAAALGELEGEAMAYADRPRDLLVVAHFDHGIRPESDSDARFVAGLAKQYGLVFETRREELGAGANEDLARRRRYAFLRRIAEKHDARIVTAHHAGDALESIALNVQRGTGWRGLAPLGDRAITRPLLKFWKDDLYAYAAAHRLEWVEDATNHTDAYARNVLRRRMARELTSQDKASLQTLWESQLKLGREISDEIAALTEQNTVTSRYFMTMIPADTAAELLRLLIIREGGPSLLRAQAERAVLAIRVAKAGSSHHLAAGATLQIKKRSWSVQLGEKMLL